VGAHYDLILHRVDGAEPHRVEVPLGDATSVLSFRRATAVCIAGSPTAGAEAFPRQSARWQPKPAFVLTWIKFR